MMLKRLLRRDSRGIGAVEFALVAPVLISFVIGISQMGKLFFANADMKNAMAHGARAASVWPVPEDSTILAAVNDRLARTSGLSKANVEIERDQDDNGNDFVEIEMTYQVPLEFIFFNVGPVTLRDSRKVYIQMDGTAPENDNTGSTTTGSTTSSTTGGTTGTTTTTGGTTSTTTGGTTSTTGGTTSTTGGTTSTTSGGTTSSTSATSASSTGGTSATSASSTSSTSSTTSASSSNGNSNGNSSHGHGNCNKKC
ncbi:MAG: TadE/TadG family type IV pilus assembly protein [Allosphingosinicella sp.]